MELVGLDIIYHFKNNYKIISKIFAYVNYLLYIA